MAQVKFSRGESSRLQNAEKNTDIFYLTTDKQTLNVYNGNKLVPVNANVIRGGGTNSIVANDLDTNTAISENVCSFGTNNKGGLKGYYWSAINITAKTITLATAHTGGTAVTCGYAVGDVISIVNGVKYNDCSKITAISTNTVTVNKFPFTSVETETAAFDNYCIYCNKKPTVGLADLGKNAITFGDGNSAGNRSAFAAGRDNTVVGQYGFASGRENTVAYASFAAGRGNKIPHDYCCGIGWNNSSGGQVSGLIGYNNHGDGNYNFLIGAQNTISNGKTEQVHLGFANTSSANRCFSLGYKNKHRGTDGILIGIENSADGGVAIGYSNSINTNQYVVGKDNDLGNYATNSYILGENIKANANQTIVGRFNAQVSSTASFIVGVGTSDSDRKNGVWVTQSGNMSIGGDKLTLNANGNGVQLTSSTVYQLISNYSRWNSTATTVTNNKSRWDVVYTPVSVYFTITDNTGISQGRMTFWFAVGITTALTKSVLFTYLSSHTVTGFYEQHLSETATDSELTPCLIKVDSRTSKFCYYCHYKDYNYNNWAKEDWSNVTVS